LRITVDCRAEIGNLEHFWQSTGFTPASLLLNADMRQAMAYVGSVPHGGITYVRIHYLLELVTAEGLGTDHPRYDWSALDTGLDVLVCNGLRPFFELMGNPSGYFTDYTDQTQVWAWRRLVKDLAEHYIDRYGAGEVRGWCFETWNEPDIGWWRQGEEAFCNYYDACSEGLKDADPALIMGGPGTCRGLSSMLKTFLAHCDTGTNAFTGETGVRLDFISVHEKGRWRPLDKLAAAPAYVGSGRGVLLFRYPGPPVCAAPVFAYTRHGRSHPSCLYRRLRRHSGRIPPDRGHAGRQEHLFLGHGRAQPTQPALRPCDRRSQLWQIDQ
jgi:hypothetical protein